MQQPAGKGGVCKKCNGTGLVKVKTAAGMGKIRCPACGGQRLSGYLTK